MPMLSLLLAHVAVAPMQLVAQVTVAPVQLYAWQRAIAGASAYCAATVVSSPIDVVKCRVQLRQQSGMQDIGAPGMALSMLKKEGPQTFFAGIGPALLMVPAAMVQYTLMDPLREIMPLFSAALVAGTLDIVIKCPFERLKTQLQSGTTSKDSIGAMLRSTYQSAGVAGLWAGLGATLARDVPYLVLKWLTYVNMQALLASLGYGNSGANLIAGAIAGAVAATAVTPADVIKTRIQASKHRDASQISIVKDLIAKGGIPALFGGLGPRLMRIPFYTSITLATFDFVKDVFANGPPPFLKLDL